MRQQPSLIKTPFVLQARDPRRGFLVAVTSPLAREWGIAVGMTISEAVSLASHSGGDLLVLDHDPLEDLEALGWLADGAQRFSPQVGWETLEDHPWAGRGLHQPQALLLEVRGVSKWYGGEGPLAAQIESWLKAEGYLGTLAFADSLGAAWALANYRWRKEIASLLLQMHSTGEIPSFPCYGMESDEAQSCLGGLPIEALRLHGNVASALRRLGIRTIEELSRLPRDGLATRLGTGLLKRLEQTWDRIEEPIACWRVPASFQIEVDLEHPTDIRVTIEELLRRMVQSLCVRLQQKGEGALRLACQMEGGHGQRRVLQLGLFRASADPPYLLYLLRGVLEREWKDGWKVRRMVLQATSTEPLVWRQQELFEGEPTRHQASVARLIDGLSGRMGRRRVVTPHLHRDPQPELACTWKPLTGRRSHGSVSPSRRTRNSRRSYSKQQKHQEDTDRLVSLPASFGPVSEDPLRRPLSLLEPPVPLQGVLLSEEGIPRQFTWGQIRHKLQRVWGAERIESGWWRGPSQRRDYYRVETDQGAWLWIFRRLSDGQWFLHGSFD